MLRKFSFRHFFEEPDEKIGRGRVTFEHSLVLGLEVIRALLKTDPTLTPANCAAILAAIKNIGKAPENLAPITPPEAPRIIRRAEVAHRLGRRSLRSIDAMAKAGILRKIRLPGRTRAAGFLSTEIDRLLTEVVKQ